MARLRAESDSSNPILWRAPALRGKRARERGGVACLQRAERSLFRRAGPTARGRRSLSRRPQPRAAAKAAGGRKAATTAAKALLSPSAVAKQSRRPSTQCCPDMTGGRAACRRTKGQNSWKQMGRRKHLRHRHHRRRRPRGMPGPPT